jgi:hypothetical protein
MPVARGDSDTTPSRYTYGTVPIYLLGIWSAVLVLAPPALQRVPIWLASVAAAVSFFIAAWATIQARSVGLRLAVLLLVIVVVLLNAAIFVAAQVITRP